MRRDYRLDEITNLQLDYLDAIYHISRYQNEHDELVKSADIAKHLFVSQSNANRMIERLYKSELINYERYNGVRLTTTGQQVVQKLLRKQAIIESFLVQVMNFKWHKIYEEAFRLRHNVNNIVLERMWQLSGKPARGPFGDWIVLENQNYDQEITLVDGDIGQDYEIACILTRHVDRLQYLEALQLQPEAKLRLFHKAPFNGPIQIQLEKEYRILGYELSKLITVRPIA